MVKYIFKMVDDEINEHGPGKEISHSIMSENGLTWNELIQDFEEWLLGMGFKFDGHLEMVKD